MRTHYRFDAEWVVHAGANAVRALVRDVPGYGAWWPGVRVVGDATTAAVPAARIEVRAPAGYRIRCTIAAEVVEPDELRARITGDLDGWAAWHLAAEPAAGLAAAPSAGPAAEQSSGSAGGLAAEGAGTRVRFTQQVEARSRLLRLASPLLHRQLARQHDRVMRAAERGMRRVLEPA